MGYEINLPLYLLAEELGLTYKDAEDLQSSLNYLQFAYQLAPDEAKNRIVQEITSLISLGVIPQEMQISVSQEVAQKRLGLLKSAFLGE
jgi:hypothetical protein